jgi:hypothetical protein
MSIYSQQIDNLLDVISITNTEYIVTNIENIWLHSNDNLFINGRLDENTHDFENSGGGELGLAVIIEIHWFLLLFC